MTTSLLVSVAVLAVFLGYAVVAPAAANLSRFAGRHRLYCPHRHAYSDVRVNAWGAALTGAYGAPHLRVKTCALRGHGDTCDEACLGRAAW